MKTKLEIAIDALEDIKNCNYPGGAEAVFDIASDALNEIKLVKAP